MSIGKLTSLIANQHIGVLKKYGYTTNMLDANDVHAPSSIEVHDSNLLLEKQIILALEAGVVEFESYEEVEQIDDSLIDDSLIDDSLKQDDLTDSGKELLLSLTELNPTDEDGNSLTEDDIDKQIDKAIGESSEEIETDEQKDNSLTEDEKNSTTESKKEKKDNKKTDKQKDNKKQK